MAKKTRKSGGQQVKDSGKIAVLLALTKEQVELIDAACQRESRTRANFILHYGMPAVLEVARKAVENPPSISP